MPLTFNDLRETNVARCLDVFHPLDSWSNSDWATAVAGETGEMCNLIKKRRRGESIADKDIADELADIVIYVDLLAAKLGIDLADAVASKFNRVSDERSSKFRLGV